MTFSRNKLLTHFYPTVLKGCQGIVFTHGVQMGGRAGVWAGKSWSRLYLRNGKVQEVDTWSLDIGCGLGVQRHGVTLI